MDAILITGAYGGMGKSAVEKFKNEGCTVYALDLHVGEAEEGVIPIEADITSEESLRAALSKVRVHTEHLDAILHFAGVFYILNSIFEPLF